MLCIEGRHSNACFVHHLPRLSVDIDLNYLPLEPRKESLANSKSALHRIVDRMTRLAAYKGTRAWTPVKMHYGQSFRITDIGIKIELSPVCNAHCASAGGPGSPAGHMVLEEFAGYSENLLVPGRIIWWKNLRRVGQQHPRDLFDIMLMLDIRPLRSGSV